MKLYTPLAILPLCLLSIQLASAQADKTPWPNEPALIPVRIEQALKLLEPLKRGPQTEFPPPAKVQRQTSGEGQVEYLFTTQDDSVFDINAITGEIHVTYRGFEPVQENDIKGQEKIPDAVLRQKAIELKNRLYPDPARLNEVKFIKSLATESQAQPDGSFKGFDSSFTLTGDFRERTSSNATTLNRCIIRVRRDTGQLADYSFARYRKSMIDTNPIYKQDIASSIARWMLTKGEPVSTKILLLSEFNKAQQEVMSDWYKTFKGKDVELKVEEDAWLHQRLMWSFMFNTGHVRMDANTGQVVELSEEQLSNQQKAPFLLPQPQVEAKPQMPPPITPVNVAAVNFNGDDISHSPNALHYPPIIRNNAALICAEYFPAFLISVTTKGDTITLQGQLKDKGKQATLKIGDKQATIDGKAVELDAAPVTVDGRLYLPAELLQQVNGIPIRWEPKKKLLWVETRYLRRD